MRCISFARSRAFATATRLWSSDRSVETAFLLSLGPWPAWLGGSAHTENVTQNPAIAPPAKNRLARKLAFIIELPRVSCDLFHCPGLVSLRNGEIGSLPTRRQFRYGFVFVLSSQQATTLSQQGSPYRLRQI